MQNVSRRNFVKAAGVAAGAALGTAGVAAASEAAPAEVAFDEEFDIVIVGAGLAGAAAAVTAATEGEGVSVLLLEKGDVPGGNSPLCDNAAIYTDDVASTFNYLKDCSGEINAPSDAMIQAYAEGFAENLDWMRSLGVADENMKFGLQEPHLLEYSEFGSDEGHQGVMRLLEPENPDNNKYMHPFLLQKAQELGVDYRTATPATSLIQDPQTKAILGVVADGKNIKANKGVVMSLGGFENSPEYLECYVQCGGAVPAAAHCNTGDGIHMCQEVGADLWHMSGWAGAWLSPVHYTDGYFLLHGVDVARQKIKGFGITVANNGRRFYMDFDGHNIKDMEDYDRYPTMDRHVGSRHGHMQFGGEWPNLPMPATGWFLFDSEGLAQGAMGANWEGDPVAEGWALSSDNVADLAEQMGVPADELTRTVDQWNVWCEQGDDLAFYRPQSTLHAIATPPFYAMRCQGTFLNTDGGARRNEHCQIVNPDGDPIPNLYGAGEFGSFWGHYYQGAGNVGECLVSGRIAVRHMLAQ